MKDLLVKSCKAVAIASSVLGILAGIRCGSPFAVGVNLAVLVAASA